jgi:ABC-type phosphate/phosphonate transport system substrate-binding protein
VKRFALLVATLVLFGAAAAPAAETLHFIIMSPDDPQKERPKYEALSAYLSGVNPLLGDIKLRIANNYTEAARLFAQGDVEGMFSGSFVAALFVAKGLSRPVARPIAANGVSTYRTAIVAKRGAAPFSGVGDFRGKRVAYSLLAAAGEVYVRSLLGAREKPESSFTPIPADTHEAALDAVRRGAADYAVVKNTVFAAGAYPELVEIGGDPGEHPDMTLIMPNAAFAKLGALISRSLLALEHDASERAAAVKRAFGCSGFVATSGGDFAATFSLMRKARVDPKTFDFAF